MNAIVLEADCITGGRVRFGQLGAECQVDAGGAVVCRPATHLAAVTVGATGDRHGSKPIGAAVSAARSSVTRAAAHSLPTVRPKQTDLQETGWSGRANFKSDNGRPCAVPRLFTYWLYSRWYCQGPEDHL